MVVSYSIPLATSAVVVWLLVAMTPNPSSSTPEISAVAPRSITALAEDIARQVARIAELPEVQAAFNSFLAHEADLMARQVEIVTIPAPPFHESNRASWLKTHFSELGLREVHQDGSGNVLGIFPGGDNRYHSRRKKKGGQKYVAISAHLDTVFPPDTRIEIRREGKKLYGPGISDNGAGLAALLALAQALRESRIRTPAPILFIGNVGEEGEGNLRGMRHIFADKQNGKDPWWRDSIAYLLVLDGAGTDTIVCQALGSRRFEVTVRGPGGHSWSDFGVPNPVVVLASAIEKFSQTPVPANPKTTFNVGTVRGGTSVNSIPEIASMHVDIRSASSIEIDRVEQALRRAVQDAVTGANSSPAKRARGNASSTADLTQESRLIGDRPAAELPPSSRMLQVIRAVDMHLGNRAHIQRASTDANIPLAMGREALAIGGGGTGAGAHTLHEWYDPSGRELGLKRILLTVLMLAESAR